VIEITYYSLNNPIQVIDVAQFAMTLTYDRLASVAWVRRVGRASAKPTKTKQLIFFEMVGFANALPTLRSLIDMR
jgi:hypothetical protein